MRTTISVLHKSRAYKLVWLNEDTSGVYIGSYGDLRGSHFSYHADGNQHFKSPLAEGPMNPTKGKPISEIVTYEQVLNQFIEVGDRQLKMLASEYAHDRKADSEILIGEDVFAGRKSLGLDIFLLRRGSEQELIDRVGKMESLRDQLLISLGLFGLRHFSDHKYAVRLFAWRNDI